MFESADKALADERTFLASIHGIDLKDGDHKVTVGDVTAHTADNSTAASSMLFQDPASYEGKSPEEREVLTQEMKTHWRTVKML